MSNAAKMISKALRNNTKGVSYQASSPIGFGADGTLHATVETAAQWNAAKALMKGVR